MQSHERKQIDVRALAWLDCEIERHENFRVERWDGRRWVEMEQAPQ